jgi:hypothetical protein
MKHWLVVNGVEMWACPECARDYVADKWHRPMTCEECGYEEQADPSDLYHAMRDEGHR